MLLTLAARETLWPGSNIILTIAVYERVLSHLMAVEMCYQYHLAIGGLLTKRGRVQTWVFENIIVAFQGNDPEPPQPSYGASRRYNLQ
jgi:hypothetical protein